MRVSMLACELETFAHPLRRVNGMKKAELYEVVDMALSEGGDEALSGVRCLREELEWLERRAVFKARANGRTWAKAKPPFRVQRPDRAIERERVFEALLAGRSTRPDVGLDDDPIAW
jgi:hypothetical protein